MDFQTDFRNVVQQLFMSHTQDCQLMTKHNTRFVAILFLLLASSFALAQPRRSHHQTKISRGQVEAICRPCWCWPNSAGGSAGSDGGQRRPMARRRGGARASPAGNHRPHRHPSRAWAAFPLVRRRDETNYGRSVTEKLPTRARGMTAGGTSPSLCRLCPRGSPLPSPATKKPLTFSSGWYTSTHK